MIRQVDTINKSLSFANWWDWIAKPKQRLPVVTKHLDHFKPTSTEGATLTEDKTEESLRNPNL